MFRPFRRRPVPVRIALVPSTVMLYDGASAGAVVTIVQITMSDGSRFSGTVVIGLTLSTFFHHPPLKWDPAMSSLVLSRTLTSADDGVFTWTVTATQNGASVSASLAVTISATPPVPTTISLNPAVVSLVDNAAAGTLVSTPTITMSDGSDFSGTVTIVDVASNTPAPVTFNNSAPATFSTRAPATFKP